jgi:hypothetical protein
VNTGTGRWVSTRTSDLPNAFMKFRGSIVVSIPACHAGDPGSIPGLGVIFLIRSVLERALTKKV